MSSLRMTSSQTNSEPHETEGSGARKKRRKKRQRDVEASSQLTKKEKEAG